MFCTNLKKCPYNEGQALDCINSRDETEIIIKALMANLNQPIPG